MVGVDVGDHHALHVGHLEARLAEARAQRVERVVGVPARVDEERALVRSRTRTRRRTAAGWGAAPGCSTAPGAPARRAAGASWLVRSTSSREDARPQYRAARPRARKREEHAHAGSGREGRGGGRGRFGHRSRDRARRLGAEGAAVVVGDLVGANADTVAAEVRDAGGRAISVAFDIADDASVAALVAAAVAEFGGLDAMHANAADLSPETIGQRLQRARGATRRVHAHDRREPAGAPAVHPARVAAPARARWRRAGLHQLGGRAHRRTRAAVVRGVEGGHQLAGAPRRLALGSPGDPGQLDRAGSRRHARRWTPSLPSEFRDFALRVGRSPRLGRPDDIAGMVAFLVSDDGEWVNGQVLSVDGGASMRP